MTLTLQRQSYFWSLFRSTPATYFFYINMLFLHNPTFNNLLFIMAYCITFVSNGIFKTILKGIYDLFKTDTLPFIGKGTRPSGATNCGTFLLYPDIPAITFGMPSGHSQLAWFFSTYLILDLLNSKVNYFTLIHEEWNKYLKVFCISMLIIFAILVSYSRVAIEHCHTTGQVIVGGIIGMGMGCFLYGLKNYIINKYRK